MTSSLDMIRGRSNVVTLTNSSGGALVAGDVCVLNTGADESATTTTSAASVLKVYIAAESIASAATGRFYSSGFCPLVTPSASTTRGRYLFTHTVAKQAAENATYGAGAFGVILKSGTTPSVWLFGSTAQASGGSGNVTTTSAYASPPTPASGDVWFPNDSFYMLRYSGSVEVPWGPIYPLNTTPAVSDFAWINQGSSTTNEVPGGICLYTPAVAADNLRILKKAVTAPYTITIAFLAQMWNAGNQAAGFCWRQNDGKVVTASVGYVSTLGNGVTIASNYWSSATAWAGNYYQQPILGSGGVYWLRCADNNTNRIVSWSVDGQNWIILHTISRTDYITATEAGIFVQSGSATYPISMTLLSWKQT